MDPVEAIPHRPPIRCVERLVEANEEHGVAEGRTPDAWEPWYIEALAQTAAMLNAAAFGETGRGMLVQVRRFAVERAPRPGETLRLRVDVIRRLPPVHLLEGCVRDEGGAVLAEGELKFYVEPDASDE